MDKERAEKLYFYLDTVGWSLEETLDFMKWVVLDRITIVREQMLFILRKYGAKPIGFLPKLFLYTQGYRLDPKIYGCKTTRALIEELKDSVGFTKDGLRVYAKYWIVFRKINIYLRQTNPAQIVLNRIHWFLRTETISMKVDKVNKADIGQIGDMAFLVPRTTQWWDSSAIEDGKDAAAECRHNALQVVERGCKFSEGGVAFRVCTQHIYQFTQPLKTAKILLLRSARIEEIIRS